MAGRRPRTTPRDSAPRACRSTTCGSPRAPTTGITARACASARARRATVLARRIEPRRARADPVRPLEQERGLVGPAGAPEHQRPIVQRHRHRHVLGSVRRFERGDAPAEERLRLVEAPLLAIHDGQRLQARRRRGVRRPQPTREQPLGLAVAPLGAIVHREVVEAPGDVGVVGVQILLPDRQRLLVEPLGLPDEAAVLADGAEDVDDRRRLEVVGAPPRVEDRARGADLRLRLREAALHPVEEREVALRETDAQVAGPEAQGDPQPALDQRLGLRIAALLVGLSRLAEQRRELALVERLAEGNGGHHEEGEERGAGDARHDRHLTSACGRRPHLQWFRMKPARIFAGSVGLREAASVVFALTALLPLLLAVLVLRRTGALWTFEAEIAVLLALTVAVLGFVVFRLMVDRVAGLASALAGPGEPGRPTDPTIPGLGRVTEIGQIGDAFTRMLDDLRGSTERLEDLVFKLGALNEVVELAARVPNMQQLLALVLERTMRTVRASIGSIMLLDRQRGVLRVVAARGDSVDIPVGAEVPLGEGIAGKVAQVGELERGDGGGLICMPIRVDDRVIGVINLAKGAASPVDPRAFSPMDLQFLSTLIAHVAYALENARLLEESRLSTERLQNVVEDLRTAQTRLVEGETGRALGQMG